jgi:hypothetical protein
MISPRTAAFSVAVVWSRALVMTVSDVFEGGHAGLVA